MKNFASYKYLLLEILRGLTKFLWLRNLTFLSFRLISNGKWFRASKDLEFEFNESESTNNTLTMFLA